MPKLAVSWWLSEHSGHGVTEVIDWLVVWNSYLFFHILGMSSSQLMNSYFSEGYAQPPTSRSFWPGTVLFLQSSNRRIPPHSVDLHHYLDSLGSNHRGRHATDEEMDGHGWTWCKSTAYIHIMSIISYNIIPSWQMKVVYIYTIIDYHCLKHHTMPYDFLFCEHFT